MNVDLIHNKKKALIVAQIVGAVFGLVFALFGGYETFGEYLGAIILAPVSFASLLRFCVRVYQFVKVKFGVKVHDPNGGRAVIERPGRGVFAAVVAFFLPICLIVPLAKESYALFLVVLFGLIITGVLFCLLDIRYMINYRRGKKTHAQEEHD